MQEAVQASAHEQTIVSIMRNLPPERISELVDFARFLELQGTERHGELPDEEVTETEEEICASEERWGRLLGQPEAKRVLREMAREAREDFSAGRTTGIAITDDGRLAPA